MRIAVVVLSLSFLAADWHQFLGVERLSLCPEAVAPWKDAPNQLWKANVGESHSSPVIVGGLVYAFYREAGKDDDTDKEVLAAFDAITGEKKWEKFRTRPRYGTIFGSGPQSTPTVEDGRIFTLGNTGILTARDAKTGDELWHVDTLKDFNAKNLLFGIATSPTVIDGKVVVMVGGKGAGIVAFDVATGKVAWKATDDPASYSTPITWRTKSRGGLTFLTGTHLRGLWADDGKETWSFPFKDRANESSTVPVKTPMGDVLLGSSITRGTVALKVKETGGPVETLWENKALTCFFSTPIIIDKHIFMINGVTGNKALFDAQVNLRCVELATGKIVWEKPKVGRYHAAFIRLKNDAMLMLDDNGYLTLFATDVKEYKELARSKVCGVTWAHPALVDGKLYLRDNKQLICLDMKQP